MKKKCVEFANIIELEELELVDEMNEILAELEIMETHQELHHKLALKTKEMRHNSDVEAELRNLLAKGMKLQHDFPANKQSPKFNPKKMNRRPMHNEQQPRGKN
jgi:hypothetical protein